MQRLIFIFALFVVFPSTINAQFPSFLTPTFLGSLNDSSSGFFPSDIIVDDHIYITGDINGPIFGQSFNASSDFIVIKLLRSGSISWATAVGSNLVDQAFFITADSNNLYVIGQTNSDTTFLNKIPNGGGDVVVLKIAKNTGTILATTLLGQNYDDDRGRAAYCSIDNTLVLTWRLAITNFMVTKLNATDLSVIWTTNTGLNGVAGGIICNNNNGNIYATGSTNNADDILLLKLNSTGNIIMTNTYTSSSGADYGVDILQIGTFIYISGAVGSSFQGSSYVSGKDPIVLKIDESTGNVTAYISVNPSSNDDEDSYMTVDYNGNILVYGNRDVTNTLCKLTPSLGLLWNTSINGTTNSGMSIDPLNGNTFFLASGVSSNYFYNLSVGIGPWKAGIVGFRDTLAATPSVTPSRTPSPSVTPSRTPTPSKTPSITPTNSPTPSISPSASVSSSVTPSASITPSNSPSPDLSSPSSSTSPSIAATPATTVSASPNSGASSTPTSNASISISPSKSADSSSSGSGQLSYVPIVAGVVVGVAVLGAIIIAAIFLNKRKNKKMKTSELDEDHEEAELGTTVVNTEKPKQQEGVYSPVKMEFNDLSNIEIKEVIGSGNFGEVHRGIWQGKQVALKKLRVEKMEEFLKEASLLQKCSFPNIVTFYGIHTDSDNQIYMVTEFMSGGALNELLEKEGENIPVLTLLEMARDAANGIKSMAEKGLVHRDLAARNLLVHKEDGKYIVKVADFGLARHLSGNYYTSTNAVFPIKWSAPEVLKYEKFSTKSDVWSFGVVLWEIFEVGAIPYPGMSNNETAQAVLSGYRLPQPANCPDSVYKLMVACWNSDTSLRPSFQEIYETLQNIINTNSTQITTPKIHKEDTFYGNRSQE